MANGSADRRGKALLICEEALKDFDAHWLEYNRAVAEINRAEGVKVDILAHVDATNKVLDAIDAQPFFKYTNWDGIYYYPSTWRRYLGILIHNFRVYKALIKYIKQRTDSIDCVFVPTVVIFHLIAWWFLALRFGGRKIQRIVLLIRNSATTYDSSTIQFSTSAKILGFVLKRFSRWTDSGLVVFATDSHRLAEEYHLLAGIDMIVMPHPSCLRPIRKYSEVASENDGDVFTLVSPGPARWEKGIHLLLDALESDKIPQGVRCVVQWTSPVFSPDGDEVLPSSDRCDFVTESLSSEAYTDLIGSADCIVLPYLREFYYARISGVAVEAMLMGIPIIFSEDTWIADLVEKYGAGLGFPSGNTDLLADRIQQISEDPAKWKSMARARIEDAKNYFSPATFQELLWEGSIR